ncbi:TPA: hypothetical protein N0F65_006149, partial [Lagenidium giganteum]
EVGEGYLCSLTSALHETLRPYSRRPPPEASAPPRRHHAIPDTLHDRLTDALAEVATTRSLPAPDRVQTKKARRRVARFRNAIRRADIRRQFKTDECRVDQTILAPVTQDDDSGQPTRTWPLPAADLREFFENSTAERQPFDYDSPHGADFRASLAALPPARAAQDQFDSPIDEEEVETALLRASRTSAPGLDGVGYDILHRFRAELLPALHAAYQFCWEHRRIPSAWKVGAMKLLHKRGALDQAQNWRPICLQNCVYKLYATILAKRLEHWLTDNERHCPTQKGFWDRDGCHEHNFLSAMLVDQVRRKPSKLYMIWYDLRNAFGSVPTDLIWRSMAEIGVDNAFVARCHNFYDDSFYSIINAADGQSDPIRHQQGVYQGCPLSPLLFITALSSLTRTLNSQPALGVPMGDGVQPTTAAFADDIKTCSATRDGIKQLHRIMTKFLRWTNMRANASKCASLDLEPDRTRSRALTSVDIGLELDGDTIPALSLTDDYKYLGIGDGFNHIRRRYSMRAKLSEMKTQCTQLLKSGLAPWQIDRSIKTYVYSQATYFLPHVRPYQNQLAGFDNHLRKGLRHLLRLPKTATNELLYAPTNMGGLGFIPLTELNAVLQVARAWKMLNSTDATNQSIAKNQVLQAIDKRYQLDRQHWLDRRDELIELFLDSELHRSPFATKKRTNIDIASLWSDVQRDLLNMKLQFKTTPALGNTPERTLQLLLPPLNRPVTAKNIVFGLSNTYRHQHLRRWQELKDQGRLIRTHKGPSNRFAQHDTGLTDPQVHFALRARLNQVETRSTLKRQRVRNNDRCRQPGCRNVETLAHVLNHCHNNTDAIRGRHDGALAAIKRMTQKAIERASPTNVELLIDTSVANFAGPALRPDIQLYNHTTKQATIVDLAIPFKDQPTSDPATSSLHVAKTRKMHKYTCIKNHLERQGWKVHLDAIVYGSIGAVLPSNHTVYTKHLGMLKREATTLDRRISMQMIQSSHRIWRQHQHLGHQQEQDQPSSTQRLQQQA